MSKKTRARSVPRVFTYRILNLAAGAGPYDNDPEEEGEEETPETTAAELPTRRTTTPEEAEGEADWDDYLARQQNPPEEGPQAPPPGATPTTRPNFPSPPKRHFIIEKDLSPLVHFRLPLGIHLYFNPWVTLICFLLLWAFVVATALYDNTTYLLVMKEYIARDFTWLFVASLSGWAIFLVVVYFSRFGNMKMGQDDELPEYNFLTWFSMLFSAGIGISLFFYGVAETIHHYTRKNRFTANAFLPDNQLAQLALNYTLFHLGVYGWAVYTVVGLLLGILVHREGLPMAMKTCFFPLIGLRIFGWMGDFISIVSTTVTVIGVATTLAAGALQVNTGLHFLFPKLIPIRIIPQLSILWTLTVLAAISNASGTHRGVRRFSELCLVINSFLLMVILITGKPFFYLNLYVQAIGFYFQNIISFGFHCDAFERLGPSYGAEDRNRFIPLSASAMDGPPKWMEYWTVFFWGWWITWAPFVGMFFAKISRGRTVRQFIHGTLSAPVCYVFLYLVIFAGAGIDMERRAAQAELCCSRSFEGFFLKPDELANVSSINSAGGKANVSVDMSSWICGEECNRCAIKTLGRYAAKKKSMEKFREDYEKQGLAFGAKTIDSFEITRISCRHSQEVIFDIVMAVPLLGQFLAVLTILGILLYFVTSADSGCLIISHMTSNGSYDPPIIQRLFWTVTEGAVATALLYPGRFKEVRASDPLWAIGVISGFPYTIFVSLMCASLWRTLRTCNDELPAGKGINFKMGLFDPWGVVPSGVPPTPGVPRCPILFCRWVFNIFLGFWTMGVVCERVYSHHHSALVFAIPYLACILFFLLFHGLNFLFPGISSIAWVFFVSYALIVTVVRKKIRSLLQIDGNIVEDFISCLLLYPNAITQMEVETERMSEMIEQRLEELASPDNRPGGLDPSAPDSAAAAALTDTAEPFTKERARQVMEQDDLGGDAGTLESEKQHLQHQRALLEQKQERLSREKREARRMRHQMEAQRKQLRAEADRVHNRKGGGAPRPAASEGAESPPYAEEEAASEEASPPSTQEGKVLIT